MANLHKTRISRIVSRQVVTVPPTTPVAEAIGIMAAARISCLVVAEKKRPVGIFTERDLVRLAGRAGGVPEVAIATCMSRPLVTIPGHLNLLEAYARMLTNKIRHHVVVDRRGLLLGVMSQSDLINRLGFEYFIELRRVEQVMSRAVMTVPRDLPVAAALGEMATAGVSCVVVTDGAVPAGILTERDAVRLVAAATPLATTPCGAVMSQPLRTVAVDATVHAVAQLMKEAHIRRVVVCREGRLAGIVTQSDIVKGLQGQYIESLRQIIREKEDIFQQTARELLDKTIYLDNILNSSIDLGIIATDGELRIKYFNPVAEQVFGIVASEAVGRTVTEIHAVRGVAPERLKRARETVRRKGYHEFPVEIAGPEGTRWYDGRLSGIRDPQGQAVGYVLMLHDVTTRRRIEEEVRYLAFHDSLTDLPNRALLRDRLEQALSAAKRYRQRGALMILDLDRFKDVNDTLGHGVGDRLLQAVGQRLLGLLRQSDTVARMGGDEFVLLLPTVAEHADVTALAAKIVAALREPFDCDGHRLQVSGSLGVAFFPDDGEDGETLLQRADIALYQVKEGGRDGFRRYVAAAS